MTIYYVSSPSYPHPVGFTGIVPACRYQLTLGSGATITLAGEVR